MTPNLKAFVVAVQVLVLVLLSNGRSLRTISIKEYHHLARSTSGSFVAVYFDSADSRKLHPHSLREFGKAVDLLDSYGIELLRLDCKGLDVNECKETNVYTYRNGIQEDSFGLDTLFNEDSIVSNILQSMLKSEIEFASETDRVKEIINTAKHTGKNVVFSYVRGYGNAEHAIFAKLAFVFAEVNKYDFVVTTHKSVAAEGMGLSTNTGGSMAVYSCKSKQCKLYKPIKMSTVYAAQLLQLLQLPKYEHLSDNQTSSYDNLPLTVHKVYIFTDSPGIVEDNDFKSFTDEYHGKVGTIIVDVKEHKDKLTTFGLSEKTSLPIAVFVQASPGKSEPYVELFPEQNIVFTFENYKHLLGEYLHNPKKQSKIDASTSSLQYMPFSQFFGSSSIVSDVLKSKMFLMVAFCENGLVRSECRDFNKEFRRVVRTFDRRKEPEVGFVHVTLSNSGDTEIGTPKRPYIRFLDKKTGDEKFIVYKGVPNYNEMMDFLEQQTKLSPIVRLPPSNSDNVPITLEKEEDAMYEKDDEPEAEEIQESEPKDKGDDREDEPLPPPEETEDDEVAGSVWHSEPPNVPEDKVPSLTDKTFQPTRDSNDLLVVNFFQPWDARSQALVGPYVEAAHNLGNIDVGKFSIRLARVNCFDWTDVCQNNNITTYPTIKLYRKGCDEFIYKGPLDSDNLIKTVLMMQSNSPLKFESQKQVQSFLTGKLPINADKTSHVSVLGLFSERDGKELLAFSKAAEQLRGSFFFGFVTGKDAQTISSSHGIKTPGILLIKRNDANRPRAVFDENFTAMNVVDFVTINSLISFGELTPMNLPLYHKHGRPLLIAFRGTAVSDNMYTPIIEKLTQDDSLRHKIFLTWMSLTSNDVNEVILQSYTGKKSVPVVIIVSHQKGLIYQYKNDVSLKSVTDWVKRCLSGEENPSNKLKDGKWEPLLEGYDYLDLIDKDEEKRRMRKKSDDQDDQDVDFITDEDEQVGIPVEKTRQRKPEDLREEHEKNHDEL